MTLRLKIGIAVSFLALGLAACSPSPQDHLLSAAASGDVSGMKAAIADKADVNGKTGYGVTPLWKAAYNDQLGAVQFLLANRADPKVLDDFGNTPILVTDSPDIIAALAAAGTDVNARGRMHWTALYGDVLGNKPDAVKALIAAGADVNAPDEDGSTPLMMASMHGRTELAQMLLDAGANPNARTSSGFTALSLAKGDEIQTLLRAHGATTG